MQSAIGNVNSWVFILTIYLFGGCYHCPNNSEEVDTAYRSLLSQIPSIDIMEDAAILPGEYTSAQEVSYLSKTTLVLSGSGDYILISETDIHKNTEKGKWYFKNGIASLQYTPSKFPWIKKTKALLVVTVQHNNETCIVIFSVDKKSPWTELAFSDKAQSNAERVDRLLTYSLSRTIGAVDGVSNM